jgi:hypothetical protein
VIEGQCLCGAVTLKVGAHAAAVSACHCRFCRRWSGLTMAAFEAAAAEIEVAGPVRTYRSSAFAERAWCERCGTHLWIRDDGGDYDLMPGLFEAARAFPLVREVYADRAFAAAALAGDHPRVTAAAYEATHPFVEDRT